MEYEAEFSYTEEELGRMQDICGILLSEWCIVRDRDERSKELYDFAANPRYKEHIKNMLSNVGFDMLVTEGVGRQVVYLNSGHPRTHANFNKTESTVLIRLCQAYRNNRTKASMIQGKNVTDADEILRMTNAFLTTPIDNIKVLGKILYRLESFNLVRVEESRKKDFSKDTVVTILPSLDCMLSSLTMLDLNQRLKEYMDESGRHTREADSSITGEEEDASDEPFDAEEEACE